MGVGERKMDTSRTSTPIGSQSLDERSTNGISQGCFLKWRFALWYSGDAHQRPLAKTFEETALKKPESPLTKPKKSLSCF